jgi:hypothetical protein
MGSGLIKSALLTKKRKNGGEIQDGLQISTK